VKIEVCNHKEYGNIVYWYKIQYLVRGYNYYNSRQWTHMFIGKILVYPVESVVNILGDIGILEDHTYLLKDCNIGAISTKYDNFVFLECLRRVKDA